MTTAEAYREAAAKLIALAEEMEKETPNYEHDCKLCRFLGRFIGNDLYVCRSLYTNVYWLIARSGLGIDGYHSECEQSKIDKYPALLEAQRRAREAGLL